LEVVRKGEAAIIAEKLDPSALGSYISAAREAMKRINSRSPGPAGGGGAPYPFLGLGPNSNSAFATLVAAMGLPLPTVGRGAWLTPGMGRRLLEDHQIKDISDRTRRRAASGSLNSPAGGTRMFPVS
jgi:hypothetical protein